MLTTRLGLGLSQTLDSLGESCWKDDLSGNEIVLPFFIFETQEFKYGEVNAMAKFEKRHSEGAFDAAESEWAKLRDSGEVKYIAIALAVLAVFFLITGMTN